MLPSPSPLTPERPISPCDAARVSSSSQSGQAPTSSPSSRSARTTSSNRCPTNGGRDCTSCRSAFRVCLGLPCPCSSAGVSLIVRSARNCSNRPSFQLMLCAHLCRQHGPHAVPSPYRIRWSVLGSFLVAAAACLAHLSCPAQWGGPYASSRETIRLWQTWTRCKRGTLQNSSGAFPSDVFLTRSHPLITSSMQDLASVQGRLRQDPHKRAHHHRLMARREFLLYRQSIQFLPDPRNLSGVSARLYLPCLSTLSSILLPCPSFVVHLSHTILVSFVFVFSVSAVAA